MKKEEHVIRKIVDGPGRSLNDYQKDIVQIAQAWEKESLEKYSRKVSQENSLEGHLLNLASEANRCYRIYGNDNDIGHSLSFIALYLALTANDIGYNLETIFQRGIEYFVLGAFGSDM